MFCTNCGSQVNDNLTVCPNCGAALSLNKPVQTAASTYVGPMCDPNPVLKWGIIGLAFAGFGILGIIFSIIGLNKYKQYQTFTSGAYSRKAVIGKRLSIGGIIAGAAMTVFWILYIVMIISLVSSASRYY